LIVDETAFEELVRMHRGELHVHCYRMLGSILDAEDLVQETFLKAWRARTTFQQLASPRTWLYRIATNTCLTALARRRSRLLPEDFQVRPVDSEVAWLEPYPDHLLDVVADSAPGPEAVYDQREATELAFVAALQHLPPRQRAVLLMRDVVGLTVAEVAEQLQTSHEAVSSAHQRARAALQHRLNRAAARTLSTADRGLLERYVEAWESGNLDALVNLLADDVVLSMPPMPEWFAGRAAVRGFFIWAWGPEGPGPFRLVPSGANGRPAFGLYGRAPGGDAYTPQAIQVVTLHGGRIARLHGFVRPDLFGVFRLPARL
jgi:RNA polymerase sigma-70 factor, ECF subfamily